MAFVTNCGSIMVIGCPARFDETFTRSIAREFDVIFAAGKRFAVITDSAAVVELPDAVVRKHLAAWMTRPDVMERQAQFNVGSSTIVSNGAMRAVMTALYWLWTPPTPQHAARDIDDACTWAITRLVATDPRLVPDESALRARVRIAAQRASSVAANA